MHDYVERVRGVEVGAGQLCPAGPTPLGQEVEVLAKFTAELGARLDKLAEKLAPALVPAHPDAGALQRGCDGVGRPQRCPLSAQIHDLMCRVGAMSSLVDELAGSLAL